MAFSLSYAFGRTGRHTRKIASESRSFVGTKFRNLQPTPLRDFLFAQQFAIDSILFQVFYSEVGDSLYPIHQKYADKLIDATACDFLRLSRLYSCAILVGQSSSDSAQPTDEQVAGTLGILRVIDFLYGGSEPGEVWDALVSKPDPSIAGAVLCLGVARVLQMDPRDKAAFANDWLSLIPRIDAATSLLLEDPDWAKTAATMIDSSDYGGSS